MAMRGHSYQIMVIPMAAATGDSWRAPEPLTFTHTNHDDIIAVVERVRETSGLDPDAAASTAIGLKLLSEIMLQEKGNPLFDPLRGATREFIRNLKTLAMSSNQAKVRNGMR